MKGTVIEKLSAQEQEIVERYYDYALCCLNDHGLDVEEYHGDICVQLCKIVHSVGIVDNMNSTYHVRIHNEVHRILEKAIKRNVEILTSEIPESSYEIDWDFMFMTDDVRKILSTGISDRDLSILDMYINDTSCHAIAKDLGVSTSTIRQIVGRTLRKLRHPSKCSIIKDYI